MATVLQRFQKLGLAYSNPILQRAGSHVAGIMSRYSHMPHYVTKVMQVEGGQVFYVNNYSDKLTARLDEAILSWINARRTERDMFWIRDWWKHDYKQLPRYR